MTHLDHDCSDVYDFCPLCWEASERAAERRLAAVKAYGPNVLAVVLVAAGVAGTVWLALTI